MGTEDEEADNWKLTLEEQDEYEQNFLIEPPVQVKIPALKLHMRQGLYPVAIWKLFYFVILAS